LESDDLQIYLNPIFDKYLQIELEKNEFLTKDLSILVNGHTVNLKD